MPNDPRDNMPDLSEYDEETVVMQPPRYAAEPEFDPQPESEPTQEYNPRPEPAPRQEYVPQPGSAPQQGYAPRPQYAQRPVSPVAPPPRGSKKKWIVPLIIIAALILIAVSFLIVPAVSYRVGEKSFEAGNYAGAARSFKLAGSYQDARERAAIASSAAAYENGVQAFADGEYAAAAVCFKDAGDYKDAKRQLELSNLGVSFARGEELMKAGDYAAAAEKFAAAKYFPGASARESEAYGKLAAQLLEKGSYGEALHAYIAAGDRNAAVSCIGSLVESGRYAEVVDAVGTLNDPAFNTYLYYSQGMLWLQSGEYTAAIELLDAAGDLYDAPSRMKEAYYGQGEELLKRKDYEEAANSFRCAEGYADAAAKITTCSFLTAEDYFADGSLNTAKKLYDSLPSDFEYNGVTVAERLETLNKYKAFLPLCGRWDASDSANRVKTISSSSRYYWIGKPDATHGQITVKCVIGSDGKVTVRGEVQFLRYSNFSASSYLLSTTREKISFSQTVTKANFAFKVGNLTLSHSANGYRAKWQVKEKSGTATNTYSADYTYNNQKTLY